MLSGVPAQIISGDQAGILRVWTTLGWSCERVLDGHSGPIRGVGLWEGGAVSCSQDESIRVWDLATGDTRARLIGHYCDVRAIAASADGRVAVSCGFEGPLRVWDLDRAQETTSFAAGHADKVEPPFC